MSCSVIILFQANPCTSSNFAIEVTVSISNLLLVIYASSTIFIYVTRRTQLKIMTREILKISICCRKRHVNNLEMLEMAEMV